MSNSKTLLMIATGAALAMTTACASGNGRANTPDEFRVVKKAPLAVPPEYGLRPPRAGVALPSEVDPAGAGVVSAFGTTTGKSASASEVALVTAADALAISPVIRQQVDYEQAKTIRKRSSVSERLTSWEQGDEDGAGVDTATGGEAVTIERGSGERRLKLPGT